MQFRDCLNRAKRRAPPPSRTLEPGECATASGARCSLCLAAEWDYESEILLKQEALTEFWSGHFAPELLRPIVPSPRGRGYRGVSKRKVSGANFRFRLGLISPSERGGFELTDVEKCAIEPESHASIYQTIRELLHVNKHQGIAQVLQYVIIKGDYTESAVIFNVREVSASVIRAANGFSKALTARHGNLSALFLYHDRSNKGNYYMGSKGSGPPSRVHKLFGKPDIHQKIAGKSFLYSPASFSQVNPSMVGTMVENAGELLGLDGSAFLYDLYCGYGLFCLSLAQRVRGALGIELSGDSIGSAINNARRQRAEHVRFRRSDITPEVILKNIRENSTPYVVLLDPPRNGTAPGVIESIAAKRPERILHIFCNIDLIPKEAALWEEGGYAMQAASPFDNFPGTDDVEMMVLFARKPVGSGEG